MAAILIQKRATQAESGLYSSTLDTISRGRRRLPGCQADGRILAEAAVLHAGKDGTPEWRPLRDVWRYLQTAGWTRLASLPRPAIAAPNPCPSIGDSVYLLGGDNGTQVSAALDTHRSFCRDILAYDRTADSWSSNGTLPIGLVTTLCVLEGARATANGGECRPAVRTPEAWSGDFGAEVASC